MLLNFGWALETLFFSYGGFSQSGDYRLHNGTTPDIRLGFVNVKKDVGSVKGNGFTNDSHRLRLPLRACPLG